MSSPAEVYRMPSRQRQREMWRSVTKGRQVRRGTDDDETIERRAAAMREIRATLGRDPTMPEVRYMAERFGPMSLKEIGILFGVTRERVRQIECGALRQIQRSQILREATREWAS